LKENEKVKQLTPTYFKSAEAMAKLKGVSPNSQLMRK